jgi:hypothetical protein
VKRFLRKLVPGFIKRAILKRAIKKMLKPYEAQLKEIGQMAFLKALFSSKKAGAIIAGLAAVLLRELLGLDEATIKMIVNLILGYLGAQGAVDLALALKGYKTK